MVLTIKGFLFKGFFINSSDLLKTITMKFGISTKFKMESSFCVYNVTPSSFAYRFDYISDFKLAAKTKITKNWKDYV